MAVIKTHYQEGIENHFATVFSCPGSKEEEAGYPAAKITGNNHKIMMGVLDTSGIFPYTLNRETGTITNSWDKVEYTAKTGRSEAAFNEIEDEKNLERLAAELCDIDDVIFCCGDRAKYAVGLLQNRGMLKEGVRVIEMPHLGARGINKISTDINGNPILSVENFEKKNGVKLSTVERGKMGKENTWKRIEVIAQSILKEYKKK